MNKMSSESGLIYCVWTKILTQKKTHTDDFVCAEDDFKKNPENSENQFLFFLENHKNLS